MHCTNTPAVLLPTQVNLDGPPLPILKLNGTEPVRSLDLSRHKISAASAVVIGLLVGDNASLTSVNVLSNQLGVESADLLLKVKAEKPNLHTLCGLTHDETELNFERAGLGPGDAKLLAPEISVMAVLTNLE